MSGVDGTQEESPQGPSSQKKSPMDSLSRDDLLKKYKSLLVIAQKAKQAKDDALEEAKQTKHKLNIIIQDREALKDENEKLTLRVRSLAEEKENFLSAIENVKSNNSELQNIVRSISTERDSFFQDIEKLTAEKQKLIKVVDLMGGENDSMIAENRNLKDDKRKLNEELFTAISERETIESEFKDVKLQLVYLLNNSFDLSKSLNVDISSPVENSSVETNKKHTGVICDLIAKSNNNLRVLIESVSPSSSKMLTPVTEQLIAEVVTPDTEGDTQTKLCLEVEELKKTLADLESQIEISKQENSVLADELNTLKNVTSDSAKLEADLMNELERNRNVLQEKKIEVEHLKEEISVLMSKNKEQTFNAIEMKGTKNLVKQLEIQVADKEAERQALKIVADEFEGSSRNLSLKIELLEKELTENKLNLETLIQEEDRMRSSVSNQMETIAALQKEVAMLNLALEENKQSLLEVEQLKVDIVRVKKELEDKEEVLARLKQDGVVNASKQTVLIEKQSTEILNLQTLLDNKDKELLLVVEQKQSELDAIMAVHASETSSLRNQLTLLEEKVTSPTETLAVSLTETLVAKEQELVDLQKQSLDMSQQLSNFCLDLDKERDEKSKLEHHFKLKEQELLAIQEKCERDSHIAKHDIELLQTEIKRLRQCKSELKSSRESNDVFETQNKSYKEEIEVLKASRDSAIQLLQHEVDVLKAETSRFEETLKHREFEMKAKNKTHKAELKQLRADREAAIQQLQKDGNALQEVASNLRDELNHREVELKTSQENVKQIDEQNARLREETAQLKLDSDSKFQLCQHDLDFYKAESTRLSEELKNYEAELMSSREQSSQFETKIQDCKDSHNSEIELLQTNIVNLKTEMSLVEEKLKVCEADLKLSQGNSGEKEANDRSHEEEIEKLKSDHASSILILTTDRDTLKEKVTHLNEELHISKTVMLSIESMKEIEVQSQCQIKDLQTQVASLTETLNEHGTAAIDFEEKYKKEMEEFINLKDAEKHLKLTSEKLEKELEQLQADKDKLVGKMSEMEQDLTSKLRASDESYIAKYKVLSDELANLHNSSAETVESLAARNSELAASQLKNEQLLSDMNELNQVLKQRGETITKLKDIVYDAELKVRDSESRLQMKSSELEVAMTEIERLKAVADQLTKDLEIMKEINKEMSDEAGRMKSRLTQMEKEFREHGDTTSEALSCSTLSRAEEVGRLRDVEDSFEERYTKLRSIAVRLKKRNSELLAQLEAERSRVQAMTAGARNVTALQAEHDKLQDLNDASLKDLKATKKRLEEAERGAEAVKLCLDEVKAENTQLSSSVEASNKSRLTLETKMKDLKSAMEQLRSDCSDRDRQLAAVTESLTSESQSHAATRQRLDALTRESKRNTVQRLEMDDYERTVADLGDQLANEKAKIMECEARAIIHADIASGLREQITLSQEARLAEETRANELTDQLNVMRSRLTEAAAQLSERESDLLGLHNDVETSRDESERCRLQAAQLAAEKTRSEDAIRVKADALALQVRQLEDELKTAQTSVTQQARELARITAEYEGYKVRAQSVLRQKARTDEPVAHEQGGEEVAQLRAALDACANKLQAASSKLSAADEEATTLQADRDRVLAKCRQLSEQIATLTSVNQQLTAGGKTAAAEHKDAISRQKIHFEILLNNCRTQLQETEDRLSGDNAILRDQMEKLETKLLREKSARHPIGRSADGWTNNNSWFQPVRTGTESGAMTLLEREEGEGSESVDSSSPRLHTSKDHRELISLEKLLSSTDADNPEPPTSPGTEMTRARDRLSVAEQQVRHLSSLLAEAEQDLARLTQLNEVLKEEIRRNQRSDEREKHAHNQEYLKNVVLKFVTLNSGDERSRLVPVLNTILKLSPEETSHLAGVAKGGDSQGAVRGWGSYLFN